MEKLNVCLVNDSFPPEIDGVANAVTNYAAIINGELGAATVVTPSNPEADDAAFPFHFVSFLDYRSFFQIVSDVRVP